MTSLADIRIEYGLHGLSPAECADDPLQQLQHWLDDAIRAGAAEPTAMTLSTVSDDGRPSARIVLLKGMEQGQLHFFTNYDSRKGKQLAGSPWAAVTFFWPELERQVRVEGRVTQLPAAVSDAYFSSRPRGSRIGAWASAQSQPLEDGISLTACVEALNARYPDEVPRPPHWGGYGLSPDRVEFWQGRPSRLHDRVLYLPEGTGWQRSRLQP